MDIVRHKPAEQPPSPPSSTPSPPPKQDRQVVTTLGPDTEFEGTLKFKHSLKIDGKFKGNITAEGHVTVGSPGNVEAEIQAGSLVIEGTMTGNIVANDIVDLRSTASMHGNIHAAKLSIEEGVVLVGRIDVMPKERRGGERKSPESK
ncbi:MAG: polymer-forming cytoskeletal protein [bacterium]